LDYRIDWPAVRSADLTAEAKDDFALRATDAAAAGSRVVETQSVCETAATWRRFGTPVNSTGLCNRISLQNVRLSGGEKAKCLAESDLL
jgi:hypothetical protein